MIASTAAFGAETPPQTRGLSGPDAVAAAYREISTIYRPKALVRA